MSSRLIIRVVLLLFMVIFAVSLLVPFVSAKDYFDQLMEDCSKGVQRACQEIEKAVQENKAAINKLNKRAGEFQANASKLDIQSGNAPNLFKAYGLVLRDYFNSNAIMPSHRLRGLNEELISMCSEHFHDFWINNQKDWPKLPGGEPDWQLIYNQILDHYFRFCSK